MTCLDPYLSMAATEVGLDANLACCDRPRAILLGYLFGAFNLDDLQTRLKRTFGFSFARSIRKQMISDKEVMCGMKFSLYQTIAARHRYRTLPELRRYAVSVGLAEQDLPLVQLVLEHAGLSDHFDTMLQAGFRAMSYAKFKIEIDHAVEVNTKNVRGFAYSQLRFLQNWGQSVEESITDCQSAAFEALLLRFPLFQTRAHFHNLYKLTVRQAGGKLIAHYTTQGRNVFDEEGNFRKARLEVDVDDSTFSVLDSGGGAPSSDLTGANSGLGGLTGGDEHHEDAAMQIHSLLSNPELNEHDHNFLKLLAGETDVHFERWLVEERAIQDVERVINGATPRYRRLVMEYLRYPSTGLKRIQHLLTHVRPRPQPAIAMQPTVSQSMQAPQSRPVRRASLRILSLAPPLRY